MAVEIYPRKDRSDNGENILIKYMSYIWHSTNIASTLKFISSQTKYFQKVNVGTRYSYIV